MSLISLREYIQNILKKTDVIYYDVSVKSEFCHLHHIILTAVFLIYSLFVLYHFAVLSRSHVFKLFKKLGKVVHIVDATLCGNILDS